MTQNPEWCFYSAIFLDTLNCSCQHGENMSNPQAKRILRSINRKYISFWSDLKQVYKSQSSKFFLMTYWIKTKADLDYSLFDILVVLVLMMKIYIELFIDQVSEPAFAIDTSSQLGFLGLHILWDWAQSEHDFGWSIAKYIFWVFESHTHGEDRIVK